MPGARLSIPDTMDAMVLVEFGSVDQIVLQRVPTPEPGLDEVLVRVRTVAANRRDLTVALGRETSQGVSLPHILGNDPAGAVVGVGSTIDSSRVGERVVIKASIGCLTCESCRAGSDDACENLRNVGVHRPGGFAEYVAVPARNAFPIPDNVDFATATALSQSVPLAVNLLEKAGLSSDDVVLISGAAGSVGSAILQLVRNSGAEVIGAVGRPEGVDWVKRAGAALAIDYRANSEFSTEVLAAFPRGVTLYVETTGSPTVWKEALKTLRRRGRVAVCGSHAGPEIGIDLNWLFRTRVTIMGVSGASLRTFAEALDRVAAGDVEPRIDSVRPISEARAALTRLASRKNQGKLVLEVGSR